MKQQIWKPVAIGLAIGTLLYFTPFFFFRGFLFFLVIAAIFRLFLFRRGGWGRYRGYHRGFDPAFADSIRSMSPEEYEQFRNRNFYYDDCYSRPKNQQPD